MEPIRVAILGQGRSGRDIHGAHIRGDERFRVVAVVDPLRIRRERARAEYGIEAVFETVEGLYGREDIDLVVNATPSHLHGGVAVDLMRHGFNVLQEKPVAGTVAEVEDLEKVIAETGQVYAVFLQSRYAPQFCKVRQIAESGILGRLVQVKIAVNGYGRRWDWQTLQRYTAGSLYNTGPHPVGQALEFLNAYDQEIGVHCWMDRVNTFGDAEDFVKLILTAPGRPLTEVEISSCDAFPLYTCSIQGDRGGLIADSRTVRWRWFDPAEAPEQRLTLPTWMTPEGLPLYCSEKLPWREESWQVDDVRDNVFADATRRLYDDVHARLTRGTPLPVTLSQVKQQIFVMEEAHRQCPMDRTEGHHA